MPMWGVWQAGKAGRHARKGEGHKAFARGGRQAGRQKGMAKAHGRQCVKTQCMGKVKGAGRQREEVG